MLCEIMGCEKPVLARGWCSRHYNRWYRTGDAEIDLTWERFWAKVDAEGDCWIWTGSKTNGYGRFSDGGHIFAHRWSWQRLVGEIPDEGTIDHLCRTRACVNPDHLEVVSLLENLSRGESPSARNGRKTRCIHGHLLTPDNTAYDARAGKRSCRVCNRRKVRDYRNRKKAQL